MSDDRINWDAEARRALADPPIPSDEHTIKWYQDTFSLQGNGTLLDFGCLLGKWIRLWLGLGYVPVGIDQSLYGLTLAKKTYPQVDFVRCMGQNLPFKEDVFDVTMSIAVFQHNRNVTKNKFLSEIRHALKRNGHLLMAESTEGDVHEDWTNDRYFSREGWVKFVSQQGFKFVTHVELGSWYLFERVDFEAR